MQINMIYGHLKNQGCCLAGIEKQIQDLLDTNVKNLEQTKILKLASNRLTYFTNQHKAFNVLMDIIGDMKVTNSYALLDMECQLREES